MQGFGSVGANAARLLADWGATVVAISDAHGAVYDPEGLQVGAVARQVVPSESTVLPGPFCRETGGRSSLHLPDRPVDPSGWDAPHAGEKAKPFSPVLGTGRV